MRVNVRFHYMQKRTASITFVKDVSIHKDVREAAAAAQAALSAFEVASKTLLTTC